MQVKARAKAKILRKGAGKGKEGKKGKDKGKRSYGSVASGPERGSIAAAAQQSQTQQQQESEPTGQADATTPTGKSAICNAVSNKTKVFPVGAAGLDSWANVFCAPCGQGQW